MEFLDLPQLLSAAGSVRLPGSKSISNRVLLLAALAEGETEVRDLLASDDTERMLDALRALGVGVSALGGESWRIAGCGGRFPVRRAELERIATLSTKIAYEAPDDFREACQLFWYMNVILQYESNASSLSLGRFDQYMWPYYKASLEKGEDPAALRELLESLWVKMNDVVLLRSASSAKFFAGFPTGYTILLGGQDTLGHDAETPLSQALNARYAELAPELGATYVDLATPLSDPDGTLRLPTLYLFALWLAMSMTLIMVAGYVWRLADGGR